MASVVSFRHVYLLGFLPPSNMHGHIRIDTAFWPMDWMGVHSVAPVGDWTTITCFLNLQTPAWFKSRCHMWLTYVCFLCTPPPLQPPGLGQHPAQDSTIYIWYDWMVVKFYVLVTSKVISWQVPTFDSKHSWWLSNVATLENHSF